MNLCRVLRKGSGVVFGQSIFHVVRRGPKTTPDPVAAYFRGAKDDYVRRGPKTTPDPLRPIKLANYGALPDAKPVNQKRH
jgi:hypothetical protein